MSADWIGVWPITSRIALSAVSFTVASGLRMLNRNLPASLITQNTVKSMSTMFSSPVSIRLSSAMSRTGTPRVVSPTLRRPTSMRLTRVTLGVSTDSIGPGRW